MKKKYIAPRAIVYPMIMNKFLLGSPGSNMRIEEDQDNFTGKQNTFGNTEEGDGTEPANIWEDK